MPFTTDPDRSDVLDNAFQSKVVAIGTTQVEVKCGTNLLAGRQAIVIYNDSLSIVYFGPTGVTTTGANKGIPIFKKQTLFIQIGGIQCYLIADTASNDVIVQELG